MICSFVPVRKSQRGSLRTRFAYSASTAGVSRDGSTLIETKRRMVRAIEEEADRHRQQHDAADHRADPIRDAGNADERGGDADSEQGETEEHRLPRSRRGAHVEAGAGVILAINPTQSHEV